MRGRRIVVRGAGLAGLTAAKLLRDRGADVSIVAGAPRTHRVLAVSIETLALMGELFGVDLPELQVGPMVSERRVDWSADGAGVVPQVALVCEAAELSSVLAGRLLDAGVTIDGADDGDADWILETSGQPTAGHVFAGRRAGVFAHVADVQADAATTIVAAGNGWIFTSPHPTSGLAVLLVAPTESALPATPEGIEDRLARAGRKVPSGSVINVGVAERVAPRLSPSLDRAAEGIRVGEAALALDPLRGDGTGSALRGALLAQAVIAAIDDGGEAARCLAHYERRLRAVFVSHLRGCSEHYRASRNASIWEGDIAAMDRLAQHLNRRPASFEFRLEGIDLAAVGVSSENSGVTSRRRRRHRALG